MANKLTIGYFYKSHLNLYGDTGNVEILSYRASQRGINVEVLPLDIDSSLTSVVMKKIDIVFMGGGPDSSQKDVYADLLNKKGAYLRDFIENDGVGLYICGSYQLLGNYYKSSDGDILKGLEVFDCYTEHFGPKKPRCIGNTSALISKDLLQDDYFRSVNILNLKTLVGFENHGGRTFLGEKAKPLATIVHGHGNNSKDKTEGIVYKNSIGTYFHGPVLSKNPHLADFLIAKALNRVDLLPLDDFLILTAHTALINKKN